VPALAYPSKVGGLRRENAVAVRQISAVLVVKLRKRHSLSITIIGKNIMQIKTLKSVNKLTPSDLSNYPIWQFRNSDEDGELFVSPISNYPVKNTKCKLFGTKVTLANGTIMLALIGNFDISNPELNEHFITLSFYKNKKWFHLARYHDFDFDENGPSAFSKFANLDIDDIFPIRFDLSNLVKAEKRILTGQLLKEPKRKISRSELIGLAVPKVT
jgi:hypothetical protein